LKLGAANGSQMRVDGTEEVVALEKVIAGNTLRVKPAQKSRSTGVTDGNQASTNR